jgi:hypothetical protein
MRVAVFEEFGDPNVVLTVTDVGAPVLAPGEVLIDMDASVVQPADSIFIRVATGFDRPFLRWRASRGRASSSTPARSPTSRWHHACRLRRTVTAESGQVTDLCFRVTN